MEKQNDCLDLIQQCIELNPDKEILHINKSATLYCLARFDEALDAINIALSLDSNNIESLNLKGNIYIFFYCDILKHIYICLRKIY